MKRIAASTVLAGLLAIGLMALPSQAHAWWRGGWGVGVVVPPVVVGPRVYAPPPPVYMVPPPVVYAPPPVAYYPRPHVWIPAHWRGPYWVPGHWR